MNNFKDITLRLFEGLTTKFMQYVSRIDNTMSSTITKDGAFYVISAHKGRYIDADFIKKELYNLKFQLEKVGLECDTVTFDTGVCDVLSITYRFEPNKDKSIEYINELLYRELQNG